MTGVQTCALPIYLIIIFYGAGLSQGNTLLIGAVIVVYLSAGGIKSIIYIDAINFLLIIFGIICIGFIILDLVGGWDLLNESLSRVGNLKGKLFNINEGYESYLSVPGTIKVVKLLDDSFSYNGIWTSSMILTFVFALTGIQNLCDFFSLCIALEIGRASCRERV